MNFNPFHHKKSQADIDAEKKFEQKLRLKKKYAPDVSSNESAQVLHEAENGHKTMKYHHLSLFATLKLLIMPSRVNKERLKANESELAKHENKELDAYMNELSFLPHLLTRRELQLWHRMGVSPSMANQYMFMRILGCILGEAFPFIILLAFKSKPAAMALAIIMPIFIWIFASYSTRLTYRQYVIHQAVLFDYLLSVMSPYLYNMNNKQNALADSSSGESAGGVSINAILSKVTERLNNHHLRNIVAEWNVNIRRNPHSFLPYQIFSAQFLGTDLASHFARAVYQLAKGATDTSAIQYLNRNAREDFLIQVKRIERKKIKRFFKRPPMILLVDWFLLMFIFLVTLMLANVKKAMSLI